MEESELPRKYLPYVRNNDRWDAAEKVKVCILLLHYIVHLCIINQFLRLLFYFSSSFPSE